MTQPRGIPQGSIDAVSPPQIYPYLHQTYPANYIPYNPYYSQLYMPPQHVHQLLSHSGFPHQPSADNIKMPPTSAALGAKLHVPPSYKLGNMTHYGISSGYGSYGTSGLGYGSTGAHDNAGKELEDKNIYSTIKQNEDMHVLHDPSVCRRIWCTTFHKRIKQQGVVRLVVYTNRAWQGRGQCINLSSPNKNVSKSCPNPDVPYECI